MTITISKMELKKLVNTAVVGVLDNIGLLKVSQKAKNEKSLSVRHHYKTP